MDCELQVVESAANMLLRLQHIPYLKFPAVLWGGLNAANVFQPLSINNLIMGNGNELSSYYQHRNCLKLQILGCVVNRTVLAQSTIKDVDQHIQNGYGS
jgi:hypothetical protein